MDDREHRPFMEEIVKLKQELREQSGELLDLRMSAGDLRTEMKSLRQTLDAIRELPFSMDSYPDLKSLLDHYLRIILRITATDAGSVILLKGADSLEDGAPAAGEDLVFYSCIGPRSEKLRGWHFSGGKGIAGWVVNTGAPYFSDDVGCDPRWAGEFAEVTGLATRDIMCVPMKSSEKVIGVIEVLNKQGGLFTRDDLDIMTFVASHASVMVENYRLLTGYEEKVRHLSTLMGLSTLLNSSLRKEEVRTRAIEAITRLMDAEAGSLLLVDEKTDELYFEVALGDVDNQKKIKEIRLKIGEGIAGWVAREARPVIINDVQNDPRFFKGADKKTSFVTRNMVCVPVMTKGKVIGVLQAINKSGGRDFTMSGLDAFGTLSHQVAIAIENSRLYDKLRQTFMDTAKALAEAIEKRDPYTGGHTRRVHRYSTIIARYLGLSAEEIERLELAAVLHDIGKIGVSDNILGKQAALDDDEFKVMKTHPDVGADIMRHVPALHDVMPGIKDHHERLDGRGYPSRLSGDDIPLMARIISVADSFDAMTTNRPYRKGLTVDYAISELLRCSGSQFDPGVVDAFIAAADAGEVILGD
jgi:GAF domain-containing protein/HD superfamily phosphohydrolase YqeK